MGHIRSVPAVARISHLAHTTRSEQTLDARGAPTIVGDQDDLVAFLDRASVQDDVERLAEAALLLHFEYRALARAFDVG